MAELRKLRYEVLSPHHNEVIENFKCSDEPQVEMFLKEEALYYQEHGITITRLCFDEHHNLVGYFTLFNDLVQRIGKQKRKKLQWELPSLDFYPAIRLHYFGVDERFRKQGIGHTMMMEVFDICSQVSENTGCLFISVEALNNSVAFYKHYGFKILGKPTNTYYNMVFKLDELEI
jgi:GNAT superfamily N-acetyltransferase